MTPTQQGNRVKTDRRDAKKLAVLYRGGTLTMIHILDEDQEELRDLVRAHEDAVEDVAQARNRLGEFRSVTVIDIEAKARGPKRTGDGSARSI